MSSNSPSNSPQQVPEQHSTHRPRQFQYRKGPSGPVGPKPEGEQNELKTRMLRHWSEWVSEYDRKNEAILKKLTEEHPSVWREHPRQPLVMQQLNHFEQRIFSSGHLQSHVSMKDGSSSTGSVGSPGSTSSGGNSLNSNFSGSQQRPNQNKKKPIKDSISSGAWRDDSGKKDDEGDDEEILWATEESGVGMFDAQGHFKFITESVLQDQSAVKSQIDKSVLFGSRQTPKTSESVVVTSPEQHIEPAAESNEWFYKDPKGNVQGPFHSTQMLEWYNRRYFPDNLPLRRSTDTLFEPLSIWKVRCEGRSPFEVVKPVKSFAAPGFTSPPIVPAHSSLETIQFGSLSSSDDPIVNVPIRKSPIAQSTLISSTPSQEIEASKASVNDQVDKQARFLESLMLKNKKSPPAPVVSADKIQGSQQQTSVEKTTSPASNVLNNASAQPQAAWKTVNVASNVSLSEIKKQQETEMQEKLSKTSNQATSSGPKSFADLLAASTPVSASPAQAFTEQRPSPMTVTKPIQSATQSTPSPIVNQRQSSSAKPVDPLKEWMSLKLKTVEAVDSAFLYSLLAECRTAEDAAVLLRDNLLIIDEDGVDLKSFSREYLKRRFGKQIPAYVIEIVSPRAVDDRDLRPEAEFSTVIRKKK